MSAHSTHTKEKCHKCVPLFYGLSVNAFQMARYDDNNTYCHVLCTIFLVVAFVMPSQNDLSIVQIHKK